MLKEPVPRYGPVPPVAVTVQSKASPALTLAGHEIVTISGCGAMSTVTLTVMLAALASVTVKDSVAAPLRASVLLIAPVPAYGCVPPVADTLHVNGLPAVTPLDGQVAVTTKGWGATVTVADPTAPTVLASTTVKVSTFNPLRSSVRLNTPVPTYGAVPPMASTVQSKGSPAAIPLVGQVTDTPRGC